jgi:hypothetical protein
MTWFDVDGARRYLAGQPPVHNGTLDKRFRPTRKTVYGLVDAGLKVARLGDNGRRLLFCAQWIDEFLEQCAKKARWVPVPKKDAA